MHLTPCPVATLTPRCHLIFVIAPPLTIPVVHHYLTKTSDQAPSPIGFLLFAPIFSLLSVAYLELTPRLAPAAATPGTPSSSTVLVASLMALEVTNTVLYFGGFIALAVLLSGACEGSMCSVSRATSVVAAAEFASWAATTFFRAKLLFKGGPGADRGDRGVHSVQPLGTQMRQKQMQEAEMRRRQELQATTTTTTTTTIVGSAPTA